MFKILQKLVRQISHKTGIPKFSIHRILKRAQWKNFIPVLVHALSEDDPDQRVEFCEWCLDRCANDNEFSHLPINAGFFCIFIVVFLLSFY